MIRTNKATGNPLLNREVPSANWKFSIGDNLRQTKPGTREHELEFPGYPSDASLCVVVIIKEYLEITKHLRKGITSLFVTYVKPYKAANKSTVSR